MKFTVLCSCIFRAIAQQGNRVASQPQCLDFHFGIILFNQNVFLFLTLHFSLIMFVLFCVFFYLNLLLMKLLLLMVFSMLYDCSGQIVSIVLSFLWLLFQKWRKSNQSMLQKTSLRSVPPQLLDYIQKWMKWGRLGECQREAELWESYFFKDLMLRLRRKQSAHFCAIYQSYLAAHFL